MDSAGTPGKQLGHKSCPSSFGNSQVPKCPNLWPWPKLANVVSEDRLWSPTPGPAWLFSVGKQLIFQQESQHRPREEQRKWCQLLLVSSAVSSNIRDKSKLSQHRKSADD